MKLKTLKTLNGLTTTLVIILMIGLPYLCSSYKLNNPKFDNQNLSGRKTPKRRLQFQAVQPIAYNPVQPAPAGTFAYPATPTGIPQVTLAGNPAAAAYMTAAQQSPIDTTLTGQSYKPIPFAQSTAVLVNAIQDPKPPQGPMCLIATSIGGKSEKSSKPNTNELCSFKPNNSCCTEESFTKMQDWWETPAKGIDGDKDQTESRADRYKRRLHSLIEQTRVILKWHPTILKHANHLSGLPKDTGSSQCKQAALDYSKFEFPSGIDKKF